MQLRCRIFRDTGFNASNIPDKPSLIVQIGQERYGSGTKMLEVDPLDLVQDRFLSVIRVKASWKQIRTADYVQLYEPGGSGDNSWWYAVDDIEMVAEDVAQLTLLEDFVTSVGGIEEVTFLDGETDRVHVSDDIFGKYTEDDPLCTPAMPVDYITSVHKPMGGYDRNGRYWVVVETTVDLAKQASMVNESYGTTIKSTDSNVTDKALKVKVFAAKQETTFQIPNIDNTVREKTRGTLLFLLNDDTPIPENAIEAPDGFEIPYTYGDTVRIGMNQLWNTTKSSEGIIAIYIIPKTSSISEEFLFYDFSYNDTKLSALKFKARAFRTLPCGETTTGIEETWTGLPFIYETVKNKRCLYGKYNKYGILSAAGNKVEIEPERIINYRNGSLDRSPRLSTIIDPRSDGKPYMYFTDFQTTYDGFPTIDAATFSMVAGCEWEKVPFRHDTAQGNLLDQIKYNASAELSNYNFETKQEGRYYGPGAIPNAISGGAHKIASAIKKRPEYGGSSSNFALSVLGIAEAWGSEALDRTVGEAGWKNAREREAYAMGRRNELLNVALPMQTYVPVVECMPSSNLLRDYSNNGFLIYRYCLTRADILRIDRLLTMYGYKYTKALSRTDFTNRKYFNFVKCSDVSVTGHSRIVNEGIAGQLKAGVRIWHVKPSRSYYTDNPVA